MHTIRVSWLLVLSFTVLSVGCVATQPNAITSKDKVGTLMTKDEFGDLLDKVGKSLPNDWGVVFWTRLEPVC